MRISTSVPIPAPHGPNVIDALTTAVSDAAALGFEAVWLPSVFRYDTLTALAVVGSRVPGIGLGAGVVATPPRHPAVLAEQALTVQAAVGNRLSLGVGVSHRAVVESMWGGSYGGIVDHARDYLSALRPLLRDGEVSFHGETLSCEAKLRVAGSSPVPLLIGAIGPRMLSLAGELSDGVITCFVGAHAIAGRVAPALELARTRGARPRVVCMLPVRVTDERAAAVGAARTAFAYYADVPSYRDMFARDGVSGVADVALIGDESHVCDRLRELEQAGVTEFVVADFAGFEVDARTQAFFRSVLDGH